MLWDAVIAGSGPAGAVAAYVLAQSGKQVLLVDRIDSSRHKVGEELPGAATRLLRSLHLHPPELSGVHTKIVGSLSSWETNALVVTDALHNPDGPSWRLDRLRSDDDLREAA